MKEKLETIADLYWVIDEINKYDILALTNYHAKIKKWKTDADCNTWYRSNIKALQNDIERIESLAKEYGLLKK